MRLYLLLWLPLLSWGCRDGEQFLPLSELCVELSIDLCEARATSCGGDPAACLLGEQERCMVVLTQYESEPALRYDSVAAAEQRSAARAVLELGAVPSLAGFFEGGAPVGTGCERDSQCASGSCALATQTCIDAVNVPLCAVPQPAL